jgi:GMP synthase (glutamine-hydrolysing)
VPRDWNAAHIVDDAVAGVRARVGDERVLLGISGGVDSTTLGLLLHRAIGERLVPVFVDTGLLRLGEGDEVERALRGLGVALVRVDAARAVPAALAGIEDPEAKRKAIGRTFIDVFAAEARRLQAFGGEIRFLAQGTLYPDVIESAGGHGAANIKSHHNVGGLPPTSASSSSSRSARCSRTRSARWPRRWASRRTCATATPSPAPAWRSACSAR